MEKDDFQKIKKRPGSEKMPAAIEFRMGTLSSADYYFSKVNGTVSCATGV